MIKFNDKTITSVYSGEKVIEKIFKGTLQVYDGWRKLIASGVPPLTLLNCKGVDLVDYKLYGNSQQDGTPTLEAPIEIESVGERTKNLFDISKVTNTANITNNGDSLTIIGYGVALNEKLNDLCPSLKVGDTVVLNVTPEEGGAAFIAVNGVWINGNTKTITEADLTSTIYMYNLPTPTDAYGIPKTMSNIQIEYGTTKTKYEPFGYRIPIKTRGKNLFDIFPESWTAENYFANGSWGWSGTKVGQLLASNSEHLKMIKFLKNKKVTYSGYIDNTYGNGNSRVTLWVQYDDDSYPVLGQPSNSIPVGEKGWCSITYDFSALDIDRIKMINFGITLDGKNNCSVTASKGMVELGDTRTEYVPYIDPITTNIYLNEPLRKIGDYADYIDFENSKVLRYNRNFNLKISDMNNNDNYPGWRFFEGTEEYNILKTDFPDYNNNLNNKVNYKANISEETYAIAVNTKSLSHCTLFFSKEYFGLNQTEWKEQHPDLVFNLVYSSPIEIEETIELPNIPTIKGTTVIEVDTNIQPSNMEVTYKGKGE